MNFLSIFSFQSNLKLVIKAAPINLKLLRRPCPRFMSSSVTHTRGNCNNDIENSKLKTEQTFQNSDALYFKAEYDLFSVYYVNESNYSLRII